MGTSKQIIVAATWDPEAKVWVAESEDVPGLVTEAASPEVLLEKLKKLIPELLEINSCLPTGDQCLEVLIQYQGEDRTMLPVAA